MRMDEWDKGRQSWERYAIYSGNYDCYHLPSSHGFVVTTKLESLDV